MYHLTLFRAESALGLDPKPQAHKTMVSQSLEKLLHSQTCHKSHYSNSDLNLKNQAPNSPLTHQLSIILHHFVISVIQYLIIALTG